MSSQIRHRVAGAVLVAVFASAPALVTVPAFAAPAGEPPLGESVESGQQVVFSGSGLLGLSCAAQPDTGAITVPADATLQVVNRTGYRARLLLSGATQGEIRDGEAAEVLFRRGPVTVSLRPSCVLSEESETVQVEVQAAGSAPEPQPSPSAAVPDQDQDQANAVSTPSRVTPSRVTPSAAPQAPAGGLPDAGGVAPHRTAAPGLPDGSGAMPPTTAERRSGSSGGKALSGMPQGGSPGLRPPAVEGPRLPVPETGYEQGVDAEPVAALDPLTATGPVGLLAIIATICVAGVTAAAIRSIGAQRANRAKVA